MVDVSDEYADKNAEVVYSTLEALGVDTGNKNKIIEAHNKIDISSQQRFPPFLKVLPKKRIFSRVRFSIISPASISIFIHSIRTL